MINNREAWLNQAVIELKPLFKQKGYEMPVLRVSCGFASTGSLRHIGQCFPTTLSETGENEIFISPVLDQPVEVLETLVHEIVHAIDDCKNSHGKAFKKIAIALGLEGKMRSTHAGTNLKAKLSEIGEHLGDYPHQKINIRKPQRKSVVQRPKARCEECGYEVRVLKKWQHLGPPYCPQHGTEMEVSGEWAWSNNNELGIL
jgi:hypothetical protein